jgi:hypothetical protein
VLKERNALDEIATRLNELTILVQIQASKRRVMETQLYEFKEKENAINEEMRKFREGFAYKPKKEEEQDMDLGKMSMEEHMRKNPTPYDFFSKEDFELGRLMGRIESKISKLLSIVEPYKGLTDKDLYKVIEVVYEELNDISMEFQDL